MLGTLSLNLSSDKKYIVCGGPYIMKPPGMVGIKMALEVPYRLDGSIEIGVPTLDFSVPMVDDLQRGLTDAVNHILRGEEVYVGCMGGRGRTGLFLAILAKAFGEKSPVEYVRLHYYTRAVETQEQYEFVGEFKIPLKIKLKIWWFKMFSIFLPPGILTYPSTDSDQD